MMLAVKRVKLPASGWLNRQDKPLPRRGRFPVRFDLTGDVRKRVITVEVNKLDLMNPIQADGIEG